MASPSANATAARRRRSWPAEDRLPHRIEAELISALGMGTNLDVAAADQSRPSATRAAKLIHPMRSIFIPHLGKMGLAYFLPSECEVAHTSRGINGGSGGHQTPTGPRRHSGGRLCALGAGAASHHRPAAGVRSKEEFSTVRDKLMADRSEQHQERLEDRRADRALGLLNGPLFWSFVHALDVCGWKIVPQDGRGDMRLPVPIGSKRKAWPNWIEAPEKPKPTLRLIKSDEPPASPQ